MRIYGVFNPQAQGEKLKEILAEHNDILGWETELVAVARWAVLGEEPDPDVFLIDGTAPAGDGETDPRTALLGKLRQIKLARPAARVVLLLPPGEKRRGEFLAGLVELGIYDIHFCLEFTEDELVRWLEKRNTLADAAGYLPAAGDRTQTSPKRFRRWPRRNRKGGDYVGGR